MTKNWASADYCCCGLVHKHTLAFLAGSFLIFSYAAAFLRRLYAAIHTPSGMDGLVIAAAATGFIVHVMMVVGNRQRNKGLYLPSLVFNVIWCLDQCRAAALHGAFIWTVLQHAEAYYAAAAPPYSYGRFLALVGLDALVTVGGVLLAFGFLAVILAGFRHLQRCELADQSAPSATAPPLPEKLPVTQFV